MKFSDMKDGDVARVVNVSGNGQLRKRMLDLGLTKGTVIELIRIAPLGDPIEIQLRGFRLTVRKTEAAIVELEPVNKSVSATSEEKEVSE